MVLKYLLKKTIKIFVTIFLYTRKNAQVVTSLQTSCYKSVHKLSTSCVFALLVPSLL